MMNKLKINPNFKTLNPSTDFNQFEGLSRLLGIGIYFGFWILNFGIFPCIAQTPTIDSLRTTLATAKHDTTRIKTLNALGWEIMYSNPDTAIVLGNQALSIAEKLKWKKGIAASLGQLGVYNDLKADYPKALDYYFRALKIGEELNNKKGIADNNVRIGLVYWNQADYPKALSYYLEGLKIYEQLNNKNGIALTLGNIGIVYYNQADYPKALDYYLRALKMAEELGDKNKIAIWLGNIGLVYDEQGDYPKALDYYFRALKMAEELGNKNGIARHLGNIGSVYVDQADYPKALDYYFRSLKISEELGNKNGIAIVLGNIGDLYTATGKYKEAEKYLLEALKINKEIGAQDYERQDEEYLTELYEKTNRYQLALEHYKKAMVLKDTLFSEEKNKELTRKEMNYEFEKKEAATKAEQDKKDAITVEEKRKQRVIIYSISAGLFLVLLLALFIFREYKQKQKANVIITQQKIEVEQQKHIIEEKSKDITDSIRYARDIQQAILPPIEDIKKALPESFILFRPKDIVSGDFYFLTELNQHTILAACDCTGHGVPGAFMSMIGSQLLNEIINDKSVTDAAQVLNQLKKGIIHAFGEAGSTGKQKDGMDMALCVLNKKTNQLQYAGANNPLFIVRNGERELTVIEPDKQCVGYEERKTQSFTKHDIQLQNGDTFYMFSDGYQDQFGGPMGKRFMRKPFKRLFLEMQEMSMEEQKEHLNKTLENWKGKEGQVDDILVIGVRAKFDLSKEEIKIVDGYEIPPKPKITKPKENK